jgi:hypothetical protein
MNSLRRLSRSPRPRSALICIGLGLFLATAAHAATYQAIDLYPLTAPGTYTSSVPTQPAEGNVGGFGIQNFDGHQLGLVWTSPAGTLVNLNPAGKTDSFVIGTNGPQQVGWAFSNSPQNSTPQQAYLWNSTAASAVNLHPQNPDFVSSEAIATDGIHQVGDAVSASGAHNPHAMLWTGSAASAVDLHPTNSFGSFISSIAVALSGSQQVGHGYDQFTFSDHALLWNSSSSAVDLHPTSLSGFVNSDALGTSGSQQVGVGNGPGDGFNEHALLWTGTAASAVNLSPTNLSGFTRSSAEATNGLHQVGWGFSDDYRALLWTNTANSAVDLQALLPANLPVSWAYSIDPQGDVFGLALSTTGTYHAVEWVPVPEPATWVLLALGAGVVIARRGQRLVRRHMTTAAKAALLAAALFSASAQGASIVLDQSVVPTNPPCCAFGVNSSFPLDCAQTFTVGLSGSLSRADVFVQLESGPGPFHWDIRPVTASGGPADINAAALASGSFNMPGGGYSFVTLDLSPTPIPVVAGQKLAIALSTSNGSFGWGLSDAGYAGGDAWQRSGTFNNGFAWITDLQPGNDLGFRTFVTVSEPSTAVLASLALTAVACSARRFLCALTKWPLVECAMRK